MAEQSSSICDDGKVSWDEETAATHTTSLVHLSMRANCSCSLFSEYCCFSVQCMRNLRYSGKHLQDLLNDMPPLFYYATKTVLTVTAFLYYFSLHSLHRLNELNITSSLSCLQETVLCS